MNILPNSGGRPEMNFSAELKFSWSLIEWVPGGYASRPDYSASQLKFYRGMR
ncbi:MAG TPA: hypothetical protein V6C57_20940 [Coleofasciculaceae cyanobacterium]